MRRGDPDAENGPGGLDRRANAGARLVLAPNWKPITWTKTERKKAQAWNL